MSTHFVNGLRGPDVSVSDCAGPASGSAPAFQAHRHLPGRGGSGASGSVVVTHDLAMTEKRLLTYRSIRHQYQHLLVALMTYKSLTARDK